METFSSRSREDLDQAGTRMVAKGYFDRELTPNAVDDRIHAMLDSYPAYKDEVEQIFILVEERLAAGEHPEGVALIAHWLLDSLSPIPE